MDTNRCPNCGCIRSSNCICDRCGFDFSTDAEHFATLSLKLSEKQKIKIHLPEQLPELVSILNGAREAVEEITFQRDLSNAPAEIKTKGVAYLLARKKEWILSWMDGCHLFICAGEAVVFPADSSGLFAHMTHLTAIHFRDCIDTSNVTDMQRMFEDCSSLKYLDLSNFLTDNLTNMSFMFSGCTKLSKLIFPGFYTAPHADMFSIFLNCPAKVMKEDTKCFMRDLYPDNFRGALQRGRTKNIWGLNGIDADDIKTITFQNQIENAPAAAVDFSQSGNRSVLIWIETGNLFIAADGIIVFPRNAGSMFSKMKNLSSIRFACVDTSYVTDMSWMFTGCTSLKSLDISSFDTKNVTNMSCMFAACTNLQFLNLSCMNTQNVTKMNNMFQNCESLTTVNLKWFDTANVTDMSRMFDGCTSLKSLDVSGFDTQKAANMSDMFYSCSSIKELNLSNFDTKQVKNMERMFSGCSGLTDLNIVNFRAPQKFGSMFSLCRQLTNLVCTDSKILEAYKKRQ